MKKTQVKILVIILLVGLLLVSTINIVSAASYVTFKDTEIGVAKVTIKDHSIWDNLFLIFMQSSAYAGEQITMYDSITLLNGACNLNYWKFSIIRTSDNKVVQLGDFADAAFPLGTGSNCNLDIYVDFATTEVGTYKGESSYKFSSMSSPSVIKSTNTVTILADSNAPKCEWRTRTETFTGGYLRTEEYKDLNVADGYSCNNPSKYYTFCEDGYGIDGTNADSASGVHTCEILSSTTCSSLGGDICTSSEVCKGSWLTASNSNRCCSIDCGSDTGGDTGGDTRISMTEEAFNSATPEYIALAMCKLGSDCSKTNILTDASVNLEDYNWTISCISSQQIKEINKEAFSRYLELKATEGNWFDSISSFFNKLFKTAQADEYNKFCTDLKTRNLMGVLPAIFTSNTCSAYLKDMPSGTCRATIKASAGGFCVPQINTWVSPYTKITDCQTNTMIFIALIIVLIMVMVMVIK